MLQCIIVCWIVFQCVAVCLCVAVCYEVLQCVAVLICMDIHMNIYIRVYKYIYI